MDQESTKRAHCQAFYDSLPPSERARLALYFRWVMAVPSAENALAVSLLARKDAKAAASKK